MPATAIMNGPVVAPSALAPNALLRGAEGGKGKANDHQRPRHTCTCPLAERVRGVCVACIVCVCVTCSVV